MSFDRFLLAVESRDLSQADKILIIGSSLVKLSFFLVRGKSERIERIHFAESLGLSEQKFFRKKCLPKNSA